MLKYSIAYPLYVCVCLSRRVWGCVPWKSDLVEEHRQGASRCQNTERYIILMSKSTEHSPLRVILTIAHSYLTYALM